MYACCLLINMADTGRSSLTQQAQQAKTRRGAAQVGSGKPQQGHLKKFFKKQAQPGKVERNKPNKQMPGMVHQPNKQMPGKVQQRQTQQAITGAPGEEEAKVMRPQDGGYSTNPTDIDEAESSRYSFRAFKAQEEIAWRRQYWCATGAKGACACRAGPPRWRKQDHDLHRCVASKPYIPCIGCLCAACELQHSSRRGHPLCLLVSVLPCHRLPNRPSAEEEAPLPRFCMLALRPCAVFCKHDLH